ncbi:hypothetical protein FSP39_013203 [Pinctada imbricata]|uniref:ENTH domain-containing protein n=1 Tax=Pinctada imbricata TaxID=66713 RepID=A0AA88YIZ2_PINIB|nr:hypothetical protein FSP39_013203 [Pinctada imbricata]
MSKQSIMDRMTAAKHTVAGQGLAKVVCKATTEEVMGPKKKHLDYLLQCTNEPNVSIPQLADLLIERTQNQSWVIVFKALITIHNLMNYGNERFTQYLASNNCSFQLGSFIDKGGVQGYDMSTFIRRYSKYLNEKAVSYRSMAFDFCKVRRGKDDGLLRTMNADKLLKTLPALQQQLDALLEFDCTSNELTNGVINACFLLMFKDLIRLFACYNDGVINLLEKYFDMNKKQCKEALDLYKKFLVRMDKVSEFLKTAESVGIDKSDIPDLAKAPSSLLDALEQHYQALDSKKGVTTPGTASKPAGFTSAINTISNNTPEIQISEEEKKRILDEENARLQQLKEQRLKETGGQTTQNATSQNNPFATGTPAATTNDIFGSPTKSQPDSARPSDDLMNLTGNPFVQNVQNVMAMNAVTSAMSSQNSFATPQWNAANPNVPATTGTFSSEVDFDKVFPNSTGPTASEDSFDPLDSLSGGGNTFTTSTEQALGGIFSLDTQQGNTDLFMSTPSGAPTGVTPDLFMGTSTTPASEGGISTCPLTGLNPSTGFDAFGEVMKPTIQSDLMAGKQNEKLIHSDLDSSLAQLAGNLNIKGSGSQVKKQQHEWQPKGEQKITGGQNWSGKPAMASTTWTQPSYQQPMVNSQPVMTSQQPMVNNQQPLVNTQQPSPGMVGMRPMGMQPQPVGMQPGMMNQPMGVGMMQQPMYGAGMQPMGTGYMQQPRPPQQNGSDPFGAL